LGNRINERGPSPCENAETDAKKLDKIISRVAIKNLFIVLFLLVKN
jgi:hypothetical protein